MSRTPLVLLALCLALAGCGPDGAASEPGDNLKVATGFYPLQFLAQRLGGDAATVESLTPPGTEPHHLELTPRQVARLSQADLVVYLKHFQPAVDEAVTQHAEEAAVDVGAVTRLQPGYVPIEDGVAEPDAKGSDPHVWLDPERYADIADAVAERLGELEPEQAQVFTRRAIELRSALTALDGEFRSGLARCQRKQIVTSHNAFGYMASAYDLEQVSITGLTPEGEASPGRLAEVARYAQSQGVTTIFFEELVSPAVAETLAAEVDAKAVKLSSLEGEPDKGDYFTQMRANLKVLRAALECA